MRFVRAGAIVLIGMGVMGSLTAHADSITLGASQDANLATENSTTPDPNGAAVSDYLTVNFQDGSANYGLMQFDLSALAGDTITSATLNIFHAFNQDPSAVFGLYALTSAWSENTATYASPPSMAAGAFATFSVPDAGGLYESIDVTGEVAAWVDGSAVNDGLALIRTDATNPVLYFESLTNSDPEQLIVNYTSGVVGGVPEPASLALFAAGIVGLGLIRRRKAV